VHAAGPNDVAYWCAQGGIKIRRPPDPFTVPAPPAGYTWTFLILTDKDAANDYVIANPVPFASYSNPVGPATNAILCFAGTDPTTTVPDSTTTVLDTTTTVPIPETTTTIADTTTTLVAPDTTPLPPTTSLPGSTIGSTTTVASLPGPGVFVTTTTAPAPTTSISASHGPAPGVTVGGATTSALPGQTTTSAGSTPGAAPGSSTTEGTSAGSTSASTRQTTPGAVVGSPPDTTPGDARITEAILPASATRLSHPRSSADGYVFIVLIALFCGGVLVAERTAAHRRT
jgi:hypothetical protein